MAIHLTPQERDNLSHWLRGGCSKAEIARRLGRSRSTVFRELKRNGVVAPYSRQRRYSAAVAQQKADARRHHPRTRKMQRPGIRRYVERRLKRYWSPDQVAGRMKLDHSNEPRMRISHETIYRWLRTADHRRLWLRYLRRYGMRKRRKNKGCRGRSLQGRPAEVEQRQRLGDWEGDTIIGARQSGAVVSLVDRKSRLLILAKVNNLQSATVRRTICRRLQQVPAEQRHTITFDNGSEFAQVELLEKRLGVATYFAQPHAPWQRGTNEQTNGLVRQFLPKGTSFRDLSHRQVRKIERLLNDRPRKCLGYRTPSEIFHCAASDALLT